MTRAPMIRPYLDDGDVQLYHGDVIETLRGLPAGVAQTCVTSPPYWGLRDYGTGEWTGGDTDCDHLMPPNGVRDKGRDRAASGGTFHDSPIAGQIAQRYGAACGRCGARRVDSQLGLEATPDLYVERLVAVFREVWRVLRDDGTVWLNLGDSYTSGGRDGFGPQSGKQQTNIGSLGMPRAMQPPGLKPKDLVGMPWRVAFALQADGWYLRSDIVWSKPNPMPESVVDRPTKAHEYLFLLSKQPRYFYDADAIREQAADSTADRAYLGKRPISDRHEFMQANGMHGKSDSLRDYSRTARNRRSVWTIPTEPFPEAHFATYPQALVRPCILAGTSERGECSVCGAPWVRETAVDYTDAPGGSPRANHTNTKGVDEFGVRVNQRALKTVETTGWRASCSCCERTYPGPGMIETRPVATRPQLVLDPFIGSGTTALVARNHGRRCIGIDLSAEYLHIAAKRLQQLSLLGGIA